MQKIKKEKGIIKYIVIFLVIILVLSYFGFDLKSFMHSDPVKNNLGYIWDGIMDFWGKYLQPIYDWIAKIFGPYISDFIDKVENHQNINVIPKGNIILPK